MTLLSLSALVGRLQAGAPIWHPPNYSQIGVRVRVDDARQMFRRIDVYITPIEGQGTGGTWVSLETISGVPFDDLSL